MKRIMFISDHASPVAAPGSTDCGGQNVYVAELARELALCGYQVDVFTRRDDPALPVVLEWITGVRVIHVEAGPPVYIEKEKLLPYMPEFTENILRFMNEAEQPYDLIHAHFFMSALVAARIREVFHIPYGITFHALGLIRKIHQQEADRFPQERISIEKFLVKDADFIVAECPQDMQDLLEHYQADPAKIMIIPCGFSRREFYPVDRRDARKMLGLGPDEQVILQLGRMVPRKGIDNVIRAVGRTHGSRPDIRLIVVGGEEDPQPSAEWRRLQDICRQEKILSNVWFAGRQDRDVLKYYYSAADIFISTPWYEPFGITPLESMACGTPVIGANVGGIKYTVKDGLTGFLVPPKNPEALARRISFLLSSPALLKHMGQQAIRYVNHHFTWEQVAQETLKLYKKCLAPQRKPAFVKHLFDPLLLKDLGRIMKESFLSPALIFINYKTAN
jgi:glycosyltransferase involved in cell wall biosynthesis